MSSNKMNKLFKKQSPRRRSRSVENADNLSNYWENSNDEGSTSSSHVEKRENIVGNSSKSEDQMRGEERPEPHEGELSDTSPRLECAICLQPCLHPVRLPCSHIFCFLCLKGIARGAHTCAMCRAPIPLDYTEHPELVPIPHQEDEREHSWFYEGRHFSGWWQYDPRTCAELEQSYQRRENKTEILVAGYLYIVDFDEMMQYRKNEPARRRAIKRDVSSCPKKGIAGLRHPTLVGQSDRQTTLVGQNDRQVVGQSNRLLVGQTDRTSVGQSDGQLIGQSERQVIGQSERQTVRQTGGQTDRQSVDRQLEGQPGQEEPQQISGLNEAFSRLDLN